MDIEVIAEFASKLCYPDEFNLSEVWAEINRSNLSVNELSALLLLRKHYIAVLNGEPTDIKAVRRKIHRLGFTM